MFLRSLTLKGFKSFADATTLTLEPGVTVVVGPNGSGKSNVVDAIAWVLGAQAPSAVRSQKMDDVIFAGTAKRPALGRAEVSLTIDNASGLLPIEFSEVTLTRTLFRTGESEYAINGVACRLLDVQDMLSDSGVGRQQHVIVGQGQIDAVLNARPEDRRAIVEEAAGVLKYRKRKEKAERRLEATEGTLLRVQDLLREVRRQLRPLERQAEAARRHGDLITELTALRIFLAGRDIAGLRARLQTLATARAGLAADETTVRATLSRLDTDVAATEAELAALGGFDLGDALVRVEQLRERARGVAAVVAERRRSLARERDGLLDAGLLASLEAEAESLHAELAAVTDAETVLAPDLDALDADEAALAVARAAEADTTADPESPTSGAAAEVRGERRTLFAAVEATLTEAARLDARQAALTEQATALDAEIEHWRAECDAAATDEHPLVAALDAAESHRIAAESAVDRAEDVRRAAHAEAGTWQARADALALALDHARSRAGVERMADVGGAVGTLVDLVDVDAGWELAFEAAAGEALTAVVMDGVASARRALQHLHAHDAAGAVLALGSARPRPTPPPTSGESVRRHVRGTNPAVDALLDALVGTAVAVTGGWPAAVDVALDHPDAVVVTLDGDRFGATGWRVGAPGTGATAKALDEARARAVAAVAHADDVEAAAEQARDDLHAARRVESDLAHRLDAGDARFTAATDGLTRAQAERRHAAADADALRAAQLELGERRTRDERRLAELDAVLPGLEADEAAESDRAQARRAARQHLDEQAAAVAGRRRDLAVRAAGLAERRAVLERRLADVDARLQADAAARANAAERRSRLERSVAALDALAALLEDRRAVIEAEYGELTDRRRRQSDQARAVAARLDDLRRQRSTAEQELDAIRERLRRAEIDDAEVRVRLEAAVESLRRDLDVEPDVAVATPPPEVPEGSTAAGRVRDLERELRLLGPINPLALEEFTALQERHGFLEEQLEDVRTTRRELLRVIRAVDGEIQQVFAAAYADVADNFTQLFATLFPGGSGRLLLTTPEDLLNTGIEVEAKPSGKNVKKLSLLSGGERSLTALAFLFAVFRSRPAPFYVMDEVEAALDDVNLHRFLDLVAEFRDEAQLVIVSHQKRTMEAADCLFGVTMAPGGSSKVVSERVSAGA